MDHRAVILNNRICLPGSHARESVSRGKLDYLTQREGVVQEPTEDDILRQKQNEILGKLDYVAHRKGAVFEPGTNCALFDQSGVADIEAVRQELAENPGAVITSVVAVKREDAKALHLESKQDFERFLRANWSDYIAQTGVISRENVRWCAAYHTNCDKNWHVHVLTWDKSGRYNCLIPKKHLEKARRDLVHKAMEPARQEISLERTQLRNQLVERMKSTALSRSQEKLARQIARELPRQGSLKYASLAKSHPEITSKVDALVAKRIASNPELQRQVATWRKAVEKHADLKGLNGKPREAHIQAAERDLVNRMGNAQIHAIRQEATLPQQAEAATATSSIAFTFSQLAAAIASGSPYRQSTHRHNGPHQEQRHHKHKPQLTPKGASHKKEITL